MIRSFLHWTGSGMSVGCANSTAIQRIWAQDGGPLTPDHVWQAWTFPAPVFIGLGLMTAWYGSGVYQIWSQAGFGHGIQKRQVIFFILALLALIGALISPLDALSESLFTAHMTQHMVLVLIAAPLLVLSGVPIAWLYVLPTRWSQPAGRFLSTLQRQEKIFTNPLLGAVLFAMVFWAWHAPILYQAALQNDVIHAIEHLSFLVTSIWYWWTLMPAHPANTGLAILSIFITIMQSSALGALLTFSDQIWYPDYAGKAAAWGLSTLQDQQIAGLVMWIPGGLLFLCLGGVLFVRWIERLNQPPANAAHSTDKLKRS